MTWLRALWRRFIARPDPSEALPDSTIPPDSGWRIPGEATHKRMLDQPLDTPETRKS